MSVVNVDENNFEQEVLVSDIPVLVNFSAQGWCGACKRQKPIVEEFSSLNQDVKVCLVDTDDNPKLVSKYNIRSVPSLLLFDKGQVVITKTGLQNLEQIKDLVKFK